MRWYLRKNNYPVSIKGFLEVMNIIDDRKPTKSPNVKFTPTAKDSPGHTFSESQNARSTSAAPMRPPPPNQNTNLSGLASQGMQAMNNWEQNRSNVSQPVQDFARDYTQSAWDDAVNDNPFQNEAVSSPRLPVRDYSVAPPSLPKRDY